MTTIPVLAGGRDANSRRPIARMSFAERRRSRSIIDMRHLVRTQQGVRPWDEHHDPGMPSVRTHLAAFRAAGFRARFLRRGCTKGRGL